MSCPAAAAQDVDNWLKFASLCRKSGRQRQAYRMLLQLLRYNPMPISQPGVPGYGAGSGAPHVMLAFLKHLWTQGQRTEAYSRIKDLVSGRCVQVGTALSRVCKRCG
jgi:FKBP12-rapamycin complex-associated protein